MRARTQDGEAILYSMQKNTPALIFHFSQLRERDGQLAVNAHQLVVSAFDTLSTAHTCKHYMIKWLTDVAVVVAHLLPACVMNIILLLLVVLEQLQRNYSLPRSSNSLCLNYKIFKHINIINTLIFFSFLCYW